MKQSELFHNETNPEDFHMEIENYNGTTIDMWLEDGNAQLIVSDEFGSCIFGIEAPINEVKMSINEKYFALVHGEAFRFKVRIRPDGVDSFDSEKVATYSSLRELRWCDDSEENLYYLPRKVEAYKKAGLAVFDSHYDLGVIL